MAIKLPPDSATKIIVHCGNCRAKLWYKGGEFINDGKSCGHCSAWDKAREIKTTAQNSSDSECASSRDET
jgi:hypothetical protein